MTHAKYGTFDNALRNLDVLDRIAGKVWTESALLREAITAGQRFYLPGDVELFGTSQLDARNFAGYQFRLPYPVIALLSEVPWGETNNTPKHYAPNITAAAQITETSIRIVSSTFVGQWGNTPLTWSLLPLMHIDIVDGTLGLCDTELTKTCGKADIAWGKELQPDYDRLCNLTRLLSLANVQMHTIHPPEKLQRKRARFDTRPLYSYHVLDVAGERWDRRAPAPEVGHGIRSHYRRGHIRRLSDERAIWVRETLVHGTVPGFVNKDYSLSGLANSHRSESA